MVELVSVFRYNPKPVGDRNPLEEKKVFVSCYSTDMAIMYLEMEILRKYLYDTYPDKLLEVNTLKKHPSEKYYENSVLKSESTKVSKKCSDILALLEFSMNRFTPAKDECMKVYLRTPCYSLAKVVGYKYTKDSIGVKGNPLLFLSKRMLLCTVKFDFGRRPSGASDHKSGPRGNSWFDVRIKNQSNDEYIGFEDLFDALSDGDIDIYVHLDDGDPDLVACSNQYWESKGEDSARPRKPCVPLRTLMTHLLDLFGDTSRIPNETVRHHLFHLIDCDMRDLKLDVIDPREAFLGGVGDRDDDFETSDSMPSKIYGAAGEYVERYILIARLLHCVLMSSSSVLIGDKEKVRLEFSYDSLLKLMDPVLFDWNYPPELIFTSGTREAFKRYVKYLSNVEFQSKKRYNTRSTTVKNPDSEIVTVERINPEDITLPAKWEKAKGNGGLVWQHHSIPTYTRICLLGCNTINGKSYSGKPFIVVTTPRDLYDAERAVYEMGGDMNGIRYMAVLGNSEYVSVRPDFHDFIEIGIRDDPDSIYRLHRNGVDARRRVATAPVLEDLCAAYGIGPYETLVEGLEKLESGVDPKDLWSRMVKDFASMSKVQILWDDGYL